MTLLSSEVVVNMFKFLSSRPSFKLNQLAKYGVFILGLDSIREGNRDMGLRTYMGWVARWMPPDWTFTYDPIAQTIQFAQPSRAGSDVVYMARLNEISRDNPMGQALARLSDGDKPRLGEMMDELASQLGEQLDESEFEAGYRPKMPENDEEAAAFQSQINELLGQSWARVASPSISFEEAKFLAKLALFCSLERLMARGDLNVGFDTMIEWANNWLLPEGYFYKEYGDRGAVTLLDFTSQAYRRFFWRGPLANVSASLPLGARFQALDAKSAAIVRALAADLGQVLDMPYGPILDNGPQRNPLDLIVAAELTLPTTTERPTGFSMLDTGFAAKFHQVQAVKLLLCVLLSNRAAVQNALNIGDLSDPRNCAKWSAQWLRPHWELVIRRDRVS